MTAALARATGFIALVACAALPVPGLGQERSAQVHGPAGSPVPEVRTTRSAPREAAEAFARKATIGNMFEVQTSRLALDRSRDPAIRAFAQSHPQQAEWITGDDPHSTAYEARISELISVLLERLGGWPPGNDGPPPLKG